MATVRREVRIACPADDAWALVGDPARIPEWFPGIVDAQVDGTMRVITTGAGLPMPEEIVTVDPLQRRFQYRLAVPVVQHHLGTVDVIELGERDCMVTYSTDCVPDAMALIIGGATGAALTELRRCLEEG